MSTTCQTVVTRATAMSAMNAALADDRAEMLSRIRADQQALFTGVAGLTRDRFKRSVPVTSSSGSGGRTISLTGLSDAATYPVERVLKLTLASGAEVSQVDELDTDAELAPRYFVRGTTLVEVGNDWNTVNAAVVGGTLVYVYGPADIDPTGDYTQVVTVPDQWLDLLVLPLAMYLHQKDAGRDPAEYERLRSMHEAREAAFLSYLGNYGGTEAKRFDLPAPRRSSGKD